LLYYRLNVINLGRFGAESSDVIKITLSLAGDATATLGGLLNELELLEGLDDLAGNRAGGIGVVRRAGSAVLTTTVHALQSTNTSTGTDVEVTGNRGYKAKMNG
jgi:hypothetical protein